MAVVAVARMLANLVPLVGVATLGWQAFDLLVLYWFEVLFAGGAYGVVLSSKLPEAPHEYGPGVSLLISVGTFVAMTASFAAIMLVFGAFFFSFAEGWGGRLVATARDLDVALLALGASYVVWLGSIYLPERSFTDEAIRIVGNRLGLELGIIMLLSIVVVWVVQPLFGSGLGVLVLVVVCKMVTSGAGSRRSADRTFGDESVATSD